MTARRFLVDHHKLTLDELDRTIADCRADGMLIDADRFQRYRDLRVAGKSDMEANTAVLNEDAVNRRTRH